MTSPHSTVLAGFGPYVSVLRDPAGIQAFRFQGNKLSQNVVVP